MAIIQILEVHPFDAFAEDRLAGSVFEATERFKVEARAGLPGFFYLDYLKPIKFAGTAPENFHTTDKDQIICFFAAKFKVLFK